MARQAVNPYLPGYEYVPDGEPYVFGDRVYLYGSHDRFDGSSFCEKDYVCWSAAVDALGDWRYEGVIYEKTKDPRFPDAKSRRMFAPDVQRGGDGRYYLYYAFDFSGTIAVACCDSPAGTYQYYGEVHYPDGTALGHADGDCFQYDPGVMVDTDGRVFLYTGFCPQGDFQKRFHLTRPMAEGGMFVELEPDMVPVKMGPKVVIPDQAHAAETGFEGHAFFEAPSIRKVGDTYVLIYSSEQQHELCFAVSKEPDRGFQYRGVIISNGDIGYQGREKPLNYTGTNHGSIVEILGQWYIFYHRQTNGICYSRQGCAEKIEIGPDVTIPQVQITSCGLNKTALAGTGRYHAGIACCLMGREGAKPYYLDRRVEEDHPYITQDGPDREDHAGQYIANLQAGARAGFRYFLLKDLRKISVSVRGSGRGKLQVSLELEEPPFAEIPIEPSQDWSEYSTEVLVEDGEYSLWFCFDGDGAVDFKEFVLI